LRSPTPLGDEILPQNAEQKQAAADVPQVSQVDKWKKTRAASGVSSAELSRMVRGCSQPPTLPDRAPSPDHYRSRANSPKTNPGSSLRRIELHRPTGQSAEHKSCGESSGRFYRPDESSTRGSLRILSAARQALTFAADTQSTIPTMNVSVK